jgi:hypothetical protein
MYLLENIWRCHLHLGGKCEKGNRPTRGNVKDKGKKRNSKQKIEGKKWGKNIGIT